MHRLIAVCLLVMAMLPFAAAPAGGHDNHRPNILFIFTDDHAFQALSAYGGRFADIAPTPNLDRIADMGMRFDRATVTNSICGPSRAVILTGKHSHLNGFRANNATFDGSQQTFPKLLQAAGYQTGIVGKWHLKSQPTGFDYWEVLPGQGFYYNPDFITERGTHREEGYVTDLITDKALTWLQYRRNPHKPFMLMVQHKAPHREWSPAPRHLDLFEELQLPEPATLFDDFKTRGTPANTQEMSIAHSMMLDRDNKIWTDDQIGNVEWKRLMDRLTPVQKADWDAVYNARRQDFITGEREGDELTRWKYQAYMKDYLRTIRSVDESVGRVLDYLEESGLADNTIVVYSSDQGFYLGEHGWFDKRFMYEESFRTPLLVHWPGVTKPGSSTDALVSNLDYAETFLDAAGVAVPADMQGRSLKPVLAGNEEGWRDSLYYRYYQYPAIHMVQPHEGVATKRYKLIHFHVLGEWELYDLENDPQELDNRYSDPAMASVIAELKAELERLREQYQVGEAEDDPRVWLTAVAAE